MYFDEYASAIKPSLHNVLLERATKHRDRFIRIFFSRYLELLPSLIKYKNGNATSIDFDKLEVALLSNHDMIVGEANNGKIMILGYAKDRKTISNPTDLFVEKTLDKKDIKFIVPSHLIPLEMNEITNVENEDTGNFIVVRNKILNYVSDTEIVTHYTEHLAEIVLSRFSLSMQAKLQTFFKGDQNDETVSKLVSDLYNGAPFVKVGKFFDIDENIVELKNTNIASAFKELKTEYQNVIGELNNGLGINSLAVDKASGVSDAEAKSNRGYTTSIANIKLAARNGSFEKLNKRYGLEIEAIYNDEVASEFTDLEIKEGDENNE